MDNLIRRRLRALNRPRRRDGDEEALASILTGFVERSDVVSFCDFRHEYWVENIAAGLAKDGDRDAACLADFEAARALLGRPYCEQSTDDKRRAVRARMAFSRFCARHKTGSLENRGTSNVPPRRSTRFRALHKKAQEAVDCTNSSTRTRLARDYLEDEIGRALWA